MRIRSIYGIGKPKKKKANKKPLSNRKMKIKAMSQKVKTKAKAALKKGKTIGFAELRIPFLALLKINVHNLASNINAAIQKNPAMVKSFWEKFGGDYDQLKKVAASGATKKKIFDVYSDYNSSINSVTIAAAMAAATPVIIAAMNLIKQLGLGKKEDSSKLETDLGRVADKQGIKAEDADDSSSQGEASGGTSSGGNGMMLGIAAAAALAVIASGKKKKKK